MSEEKLEAMRMRQFKAQPVPILEPFVPKRSTKALTVLSDVQLNSDTRSEKRKTFDEQIAKKIAVSEEMQRQREQEMKVCHFPLSTPC